MKNEIRRRVLEARKGLSAAEGIEKSRRIAQRFLNHPALPSARTVMLYLDFRQEVQTGEIIKALMALGKRVVIPVCRQEEVALIPSELKDYPGDLTAGTWGILEPKPECLRPIDPGEIDLVVVPGVAFDSRGNRLGYGAGYYDRFLSRVGEGAPRIALAYQLQIVEDAMPQPHDLPMDWILTEEMDIQCRNKPTGSREESCS